MYITRPGNRLEPGVLLHALANLYCHGLTLGTALLASFHLSLMERLSRTISQRLR
jgi:hypothetical protein